MSGLPWIAVTCYTVLVLCLLIGSVDGAAVDAGEDEVVILGENSFTLTCRFTVEPGERKDSLEIQHRRYPDVDYQSIFTFNLLANRSFYADSLLADRAKLVLSDDWVSVTYNTTMCSDNGTYRCFFLYARGDVMHDAVGEIQLTVDAEPEAPSLTETTKTVFSEHETMNCTCSAYIGTARRNILWYGVRNDQSPVDLTSLATQSSISQDNSGPRFCVFKRSSSLILNLTRNHNGFSVLCLVNRTSRDPAASPSLPCDRSTCASSPRVSVQYGIRQEDLVIKTVPNRTDSTFDVGSSVTLRCDVDGNPTPYFKWTKDNGPTIFEGAQEMMLRNLSMGSSGLYSCHGNNTVNGFAFSVTKSIGIKVVMTTTTSTTPSTTSTTTEAVNVAGVTGAPLGLAWTTIIIIICAAVFLLIIFVVILVCCCCKKRKEEKLKEGRPVSSAKNNEVYKMPTFRKDEPDGAYAQASAPYGSRMSSGPDVLKGATTPYPDYRDPKYLEDRHGYSDPGQYDNLGYNPIDPSHQEYLEDGLQFVPGISNLDPRPRSRRPIRMLEYDDEYLPDRPEMLVV